MVRLMGDGRARPGGHGQGPDRQAGRYVVAGLLIEKLTGRPYGQEIKRRILRPYGLTQTIVPGDQPGLAAPAGGRILSGSSPAAMRTLDTTDAGFGKARRAAGAAARRAPPSRPTDSALVR
ncbi:beta-lactamase family protein [Nonomuraea polychroma]|uniref:beta-lactamase family protein n=1 Tax=Nonomuraea polychroma TaxID=46176 RepID=UPI001F4E8983|nr:beta-lactamase family protein [Nonomuraea polychroma]